MEELNFYSIDKKYLDYLRAVDPKVPHANYQDFNQFEKLYCGIVIFIENYLYFAPLSHRTSHKQTSFIIRHPNKTAFASLPLKFMIPIINMNVLNKTDFKKITDRKYANLLSEELQYCRQHRNDIIKKANFVYTNRLNKKKGFEKFCCDFKELEKAADKY